MTDAAKYAQENGKFIIWKIKVNCLLIFFLYSYYDIECLFIETSALNGENVEEIFNKITHTIIYKIDSGEIPDDLIANNKK